MIEAADRILPLYDAELTRPVSRRLQALGVETMANAKATGLSDGGDALLVETSSGRREVAADKILVAVGRRPRTDGWGLERLDLAMIGPFIGIDERCATSMRNVWAIGDVTGEPMLAHRAMAQGAMVADIVAGHRRAFHKVVIPAVCFTDPEIVTAGLAPDEARTAGYEVRTGVFPLQANGRAMTLQAEDGFVRVTARADNHLVLGIQAVGAGVSELSAAFGLALEMGARLEDIAGTIHAHPTLGEAFHEASLNGFGECPPHLNAQQPGGLGQRPFEAGDSNSARSAPSGARSRAIWRPLRRNGILIQSLPTRKPGNHTSPQLQGVCRPAWRRDRRSCH